ncbi:hypothetical protein D3C83_313510 [compost metagenome]
MERRKVGVGTLKEVLVRSKSTRTANAVPVERTATAVVTLVPWSKATRAAM